MDMRLADWSDKLLFGIETIDAQHKQLFELAASFEGNGDQIRVMKTLALLCNYVKEHFREEEEMLAQCGYPHLEAHKRIHEEFRGMLLELLSEATKLTLDEIADRVRYLINGWFYNHIMVTDLDYVPLVKARIPHYESRYG
jgi:hemerythrin